MKKEIKKLSLHKKTISNLNSSEMSPLIGGSATCWPSKFCGNQTKNGKTCYGHNTCQYTCI